MFVFISHLKYYLALKKITVAILRAAVGYSHAEVTADTSLAFYSAMERTLDRTHSFWELFCGTVIRIQ